LCHCVILKDKKKAAADEDLWQNLLSHASKRVDQASVFLQNSHPDITVGTWKRLRVMMITLSYLI
jgi:hypothetical protein